MATSESDDFESADEEMNNDIPMKRNIQTQQWSSPTTIDSESDDDTEFVPRTPYKNIYDKRTENYFRETEATAVKEEPDKNLTITNKDVSVDCPQYSSNDNKLIVDSNETSKRDDEEVKVSNLQQEKLLLENNSTMDLKLKENNNRTIFDQNDAQHCENLNVQTCTTKLNTKEKVRKQQKLGIKITDCSNSVATVGDITSIIKFSDENVSSEESLIIDELTESDMPEEMKSNKKFKEVFKPEGWEGLGDTIELSEELTEDKLQPILQKLSLAGEKSENSSSGWGWSNWGVSSLINTASAGVSTLTNHVSNGLTFLEESVTVPEESKFTEFKEEENRIIYDNTIRKSEETQPYSSFGFENLISGVSSITKLVESTGSKVMSGGLDTLEAIGKKTMEVLQESDPSLKKKVAFLMNETEKPNLSRVLREAKEKAEAAKQTIEEKKRMRKVHFESLFDDYQGLVHLEALEMLSKQSHIKIQQHLTGLDISELNSVQETLEEVKELCDLGDDNNESDIHNKDLNSQLQEACNDLGIDVTYDKLHLICKESEVYLLPPVAHMDQEIFEHAISRIAQFTAFAVERFHKTAELLLIKEHRSTVNEADALVHLTHILTKQIQLLANTYCSFLNAVDKTSVEADNVNTYTATILMEASNGSSYIQDAFKLLIPIIQAGAI